MANKSVHLRKKHVIELIPQKPFNFDATMHKPDHFPSSDNRWVSGIRWQTMLWQGTFLGLKFENQGTVARPKVLLTIWSAKHLDSYYIQSLEAEIIYRYGMELELSEFVREFKRDPLLGPILKKWRGLRPLNYSSLYEYLIISIVLQNTFVRRSVQMLQVLFENYGTLLHYDSQKLYCFWAPEVINQVTEQELRKLKLGYRAKSIKRVTEAFANRQLNEIDLRIKNKEDQRNTLLGLFGIGPASVGYILFDVFHHFDELNYIPPWEGKIYSKLFFNRMPDNPVATSRLLEFFDNRFGKYKMLAVHYIWEDLFWKRKYGHIDWLETLIRL